MEACSQAINGGLDMGVQAVIGGDVVWHVEFDAAPSKILKHHWPTIPNYGDITTVDWSQVEPVDVLTGGFPCQDLSLAGRRAGMRPGTRSGLWGDFLKAIDTLRPGLVIIENVRGLLSGCAESDLEPCPGCVGDAEHRPVLRALGRVLGDLAGIGYDAEWVGVRAADAGAPHGRFRVFVLAYPSSHESERWGGVGVVGSAASSREGDGEEREWLRNSIVNSGEATAYPENDGHERAGDSRDGWTGSADGHKPAGNPHLTGLERRPIPTERPNERSVRTNDLGVSAWGVYEPAIRRWEHTTGRIAPSPTNPDGKNGQHRLSAQFVEWMMGLPAGHVTAPEIGLTRNEQLKALGNGVVPQQAELALRMLLQRHETETQVA